jgi:S-formylglutathione hydrolase
MQRHSTTSPSWSRHGPLLVDQGSADPFLEDQLKPNALKAAAEESKLPLELRVQEGYDHSYFFVASFLDDHLKHHAALLG